MTAAVRHALPDDDGWVTETLVEAFTDDPLQAYLFPDPGSEGSAAPAALRALMGAEVATYLPHGHLYVVDGRAAALWTPPGVTASDDLLIEELAAHADEATATESFGNFVRLSEARPDRPHFYLAVLGAGDESRGQGLGSILLRRVLNICDTEGILAHLESSNVRNVGLYERHGFEVTEEVEFAPGVIVRPMTRQPLA